MDYGEEPDHYCRGCRELGKLVDKYQARIKLLEEVARQATGLRCINDWKKFACMCPLCSALDALDKG